MPGKKRRELSGDFGSYALGEGSWRLERTTPRPAQVFVRGVDAAAAAGAAGIPGMGAVLRDLVIEWDGGAARLAATTDGRRVEVIAASIIVHEPLDELYHALPLAELDAPARRVGRRVFRIARLPGGRFLLGLVAKSARRR